MPPAADSLGPSRRDFLLRSGWLAAGLTVLSACGAVRGLLPALPSTGDPEPEDGLAWVQALPDGRIRFYCPRMEMGQGAGLGLSQVVAEELNVEQAAVDCLLPDSKQVPPFKMTAGSESIARFFEPVSHGAAVLREALRMRAAERAGLPLDRVRDGEGGFVAADGVAYGYGSLVPAEPLVLTDPGLTLPDDGVRRHARDRRGQRRAIGRSWRHAELEAMVTGRTRYSQDVVLPDMLYGRVARPPALGVVLERAEAAAARARPGVVAALVDHERAFAAVVTEDPFLLETALEALAPRWSAPAGPEQSALDASLDVERAEAMDDFEHVLSESGDLEQGRQRAAVAISARYDTPFAAHAAMEPRAAVASARPDGVEVWCGCQDPFFVRQRVARRLGRDEASVVVHPLRMGGGFGGRVFCQAAEEAALLSDAVGRPVRVQWDRAAEFQGSYFQPAFSHRIEAGITAEGRISHWAHDFVSAPIITGPVPGGIAWALDRLLADEGTARGAVAPYSLPHSRVRYSDIRTAVPVGAWRGLGSAPNAFAIESMVDELAAAAGIDPLVFRLNNLPSSSERLAGVLRRVAEISDWGRATAPDRGRGLACAVYKGETAVAVVAELEVDHAARRLRVARVWCAQDCGLVVNPSQVEGMVMGNVVWGCGAALKERIGFEAGRIEADNFDGYEILRQDDCPEITVALVEPPGAAPVGVGESAFAPVVPAVANAIFAASGRRVRRLPISYDSVFRGR